MHWDPVPQLMLDKAAWLCKDSYEFCLHPVELAPLRGSQCVWEQSVLRPGFNTGRGCSEPNSFYRATASPDMGAGEGTHIQAVP